MRRRAAVLGLGFFHAFNNAPPLAGAVMQAMLVQK
jgi:hypothetical protein